MGKLEANDLSDALRSVPKWRRRRQEIHRAYALPDFGGAMRLVNRVAKLAERANHHPDILVQWYKRLYYELSVLQTVISELQLRPHTLPPPSDCL